MIFKKPTGSVRFWFYKPETKKTELNPNRKKLKKRVKLEKTEPNRKIRAKLKKPSQTGK